MLDSIKIPKDKKIVFSIDRLTIVSDFKYRDLFFQLSQYIEKNELYNECKNLSTFFSKSYDVPGLGFLQLDSKTMKFRLDFNPNNITLLGKKEFNYILCYLNDIHFTRLDLAIDLFNYNIKDYNIIDIGNRKSAYFYDRTGKLETIYSGSMKSDKYIRIYNKAVEQKIKNVDWWRFEIQLRDVWIDKYFTELTDFYRDILVFQYNCVSNYSIEENAMIEYLLHDISRIEKLGKNSRIKYRRIIRSLEFSSLDFFDNIITLTSEKVIDYLNYISSNKMYPDSSSIKITSI